MTSTRWPRTLRSRLRHGLPTNRYQKLHVAALRRSCVCWPDERAHGHAFRPPWTAHRRSKFCGIPRHPACEHETPPRQTCKCQCAACLFPRVCRAGLLQQGAPGVSADLLGTACHRKPSHPAPMTVHPLSNALLWPNEHCIKKSPVAMPRGRTQYLGAAAQLHAQHTTQTRKGNAPTWPPEGLPSN